MQEGQPARALHDVHMYNDPLPPPQHPRHPHQIIVHHGEPGTHRPQFSTLSPAATSPDSHRLLQSTESVLDSSVVNSKKLKSVLQTAGRRKDSYTGILFNTKHFERYKVLQEGANHILSEEGPLARDMYGRIQDVSHSTR